jgi:hypothetical protein
MFCTEPRIWILLVGSARTLFDGYTPSFLEVNIDLRVGQDDTCSARILNREFDFAALACYTTCRGQLAHQLQLRSQLTGQCYTYRSHVTGGLRVVS